MYKEKKVKLISAMSHAHSSNPFVIGNGKDLPWPPRSIPSDMRRFRQLTKGGSVIIGRVTWDTIRPKYRPFDKDIPVDEARQTIVVTRNSAFKVDDPRVMVAHSLEEALRVATREVVWIGGGSQIYKASYAYIDELHMTLVKGNFDGDVHFPLYPTDSNRPICTATIAEGRLDLEDLFETKYVFAKIADQKP